jgi:hypothetical protein
MRSSSLLPLELCFLLLLLVALGCKKPDVNSDDNRTINKVQSSVSNRTLFYLESQKIKASGSKNTRTQSDAYNANIDLLKENLDFEKADSELLDNRFNFLTIPIKDEVITQKNLKMNSSLVLLLITDKAGNINSGSIVYFQPSDGEKHSSLPHNTFSNLINRKDVPIDGLYRMLTITGRWLSQFEIKHHKLASAAKVESSSSNSRSTQKTQQSCIDWYLVTTTYYSNGTSSEERTYLTTTCVGDTCETGDYNTLCSPTSGVGGSNNEDQIVDGEDDATSAETKGVQSSDLSGNLSAGGYVLSWEWTAHLTYQYNYSTYQFINVRQFNPYAIPASIPFTDDNGNPATLHISVLSYTTKWYPLTLATMFASWDIFYREDWLFTTGSRVYTFDFGLSRVCAAP